MQTIMLILAVLLVFSICLNFVQVLLNSSYTSTSVEKFIKIRKKFFIKHIDELITKAIQDGSYKLTLSKDLIENDIFELVLKDYSDKGFKYRIEPYGDYMVNIYFSARSEYLK